MWVLGEDTRRGLFTPVRYSRKSIGAVTNKRKVIRNRPGRYAEFFNDASLIADCVGPAVKLHDPSFVNALAQVLVGRADVNALDSVILCRPECGRGHRIVRFELDHWPYDDAHAFQRFF